MNKSPLFDLSCGVYILSARKGEKMAGCIINTCIQIATSPDRIIVSVMNNGHTRKMIKETGKFCVAILDENTSFGLISHFGYKTSDDIDKFKNIPTFPDMNGIPCVIDSVCAYLSCKVVDSINLGSHTLFIGKVKDMKRLSDVKPLTYADYQERVKPKPFMEKDKGKEMGKGEEDKLSDQGRIIGYRCTICGYVYDEVEFEDEFKCPVCGHPKEDFVPIYENEKM